MRRFALALAAIALVATACGESDVVVASVNGNDVSFRESRCSETSARKLTGPTVLASVRVNTLARTSVTPLASSRRHICRCCGGSAS